MPEWFLPWPRAKPFPESQKDSLAVGSPDFPGSSGDRERGKFRPSDTPGLTQVAVVDDAGNPIGSNLVNPLDELLLEMRAIRIGLELQLLLTHKEVVDLRAEAMAFDL